MSETTKYGIIGAGKVGLSIAELLLDQGKLSFIYDKNPDSIPGAFQDFVHISLSSLPKVEFIYIAISDPYLKSLAAEIKEAYPHCGNAIFAHSSGVKGANELLILGRNNLGIASVHPFQTFAFADKSNLKDIAWGIECRDDDAQFCIDFVETLGGNYFRLDYGSTEQKVLYHCSAVMSSNNMTTLLQAGRLIAEKAGIPPKEFIEPITKKTLDNNIKAFSKASIPLTGPIARADKEAIENHISALSDTSLIRIYCYSALATLELSLREGIILKENYLEIKKVLESHLD